MPRQPRIEHPGALYHVMSRGNRRERIFMSTTDYKCFMKFLFETISLCNIRLYAWCLMPNHFHVLLETPEGNISLFMRILLTRYARYFNISHKMVGHVFHGRFKAILCDKETYLQELVRYIHLNPIKVKSGSLCRRPEDWKWSSHRYYLSIKKPLKVKETINEILGMFGEGSKAIESYENFVLMGLDNTNWEGFYKIVGNRFLGNERFIEDAKRISDEPVREKPRELMKIYSLDELLKVTSNVFNINEEELKSESQERAMSKYRKAFVYIGRKHYRFQTIDLARSLNRDITAVSQIMRRLKDKGETMIETQRLMAALS